MKKMILLALTALMMVGCGFKNNQDVSRHVIILDSCEYIQYYSDAYYYTSIEHKGNCRFCKERDSIKWEKRKKELEELVIKLKEK